MSTATSARYETHPFERAGLGTAPFRLVGYVEKVYQSCQGAPVQAAGTCDYCGQCIRHCYIVASSDKREFTVGCDCAGRCGEDAMAREMRALRRAEERRIAEIERAEREARERRNNEAKGLGALTDDEIRYAAEVARKAAEQAKRDEAEARRLASQHVGAVGKRVEMTLRLTFVTSWATDYGTTRLYSLEDADGNVVVWKTSSGALVTDDWEHAKIGDSVVVRATVKRHGEYRGGKQTEVSRLKVLRIIRAEKTTGDA